MLSKLKQFSLELEQMSTAAIRKLIGKQLETLANHSSLRPLNLIRVDVLFETKDNPISTREFMDKLTAWADENKWVFGGHVAHYEEEIDTTMEN